MASQFEEEMLRIKNAGTSINLGLLDKKLLIWPVSIPKFEGHCVNSSIIAIAVVLEGIKCRLWSRWSSSPSRWKGGFTTLLEAYVEEGHVEGVRVEPEGVEPKKAGMARGPSSESEE